LQEPKEATSLKQMFQGMVPEGTTVVVGTVVSASPVKVRIENDEKLTISGSVLLIPRFLTDWSATVDIEAGELDSTTTTNDLHNHKLQTFNVYGATMTVHNALKVGDTICLLKFNNGKNYLAIDRTSWV